MAVTFVLKNEQRTTDCLRGLNILGHAQIEELDVGSRCGGHGVCGGDRVKVSSTDGPLSPITAEEREHFAQWELDAGWRLACQCWPEKDGQEVTVTR